MPVGKKLAVVLSIVIVGASVALFFRKDASAFRFWRTGQDDPFARPVERRVTTDAAWAHRDTAAQSNSPDGPARRVPAASTAAISEPKGLGSGSQPSFRKNLNPVGALLPPIEGIVGEEDATDTPDDLAGEHAFMPAGQNSRHVVVDGDTLSNLAARYLGRADAYLEIYECNRDVLASPDLLPIGAVLKIPSAHPADDKSARRGLAPGDGEIAPDTSRMVPVVGSPG
jgi:phage tail protein X